MKQLTITSMRGIDFKGMVHEVLDAHGQDVDVYGRNATGKTSRADLFNWILFGKDSTGRSDSNFEIKRINHQEKTQATQASGELVLSLDGKEHIFSRVYKEDWQEKRGSGTKEMTGHSTTYSLNGIDVPKRQYEDAVRHICDETVFRSITDPRFFSSDKVHWTKRRQILVDMVGEVTDEQILYENPKLEPLRLPLIDRGIDAHKKWLESGMKRINESQRELPGKIAEADRFSKNKPEKSKGALEDTKGALESKLRELAEQKSQVSSGGEVARIGVKISEINAKMLDRTNALKREASRDHDSWEAKLSAAKRTRSDRERDVQSLKTDIVNIDLRIEARTGQLTTLKSDRDAKAAEIMYRADFVAPTVETRCPRCGQSLEGIDEDQIIANAKSEYDAKTIELQEEFNVRKAQSLARIDEEAKGVHNQKKGFEAEKSALETRLGSAKEALGLAEDAEREAGQNEPEVSQVDVTLDSEYQSLVQEKAELERKKSEAVSGDDTTELDLEIQLKNIELDGVKRMLVLHETASEAEGRVKELQAQRLKNQGEYDKLAGEFYLCEEFGRAKARALNEKINEKFKYAKWVLFEDQQNGGLNEVCYATFKGVPFPDLNNGSQINVGLDIINTLSTYYELAAPIFIDNAESVNRLIKTYGQQIRLRVTEDDEVLRIERKER